MNPELTQALAFAADGRSEEAMAIITRLAGAGDLDAMFTLADVHWRGVMVPQDMPLARRLFEQLSDAGHPIAVRAFTNLLASGVASETGPDWPRMLTRLRDEAQYDARRAQMLELIGKMKLTPKGDPVLAPRGQRVSNSPELTVFPDLFTHEECGYLRLVAEPTYEESMVVGPDGRDYRDTIRTSDGASMHWLIEDPMINALNRRLAAASRTAYDQGEPLLILRYRPGQQYRRHYDALPGVTNQRFRTALAYLNDDYEGGETEFPRAGIQVKGIKGNAIVFRNSDGTGRYDPMSEHCGLPVTSGVKYLASRWIRERRHIP